MHKPEAWLQESLSRLDRWVRAAGFAGWDPFDALSSPLFQPVARLHPLPGILLTQLLKRSPFNLRPLLGIGKSLNAKGTALFLLSFLHLYRQQPAEETLEGIRFLARALYAARLQGSRGTAWGYSFPWANRSFAAPANTPNVVCTCFAGQAWLQLWQVFGERWPDLLPESPLALAGQACAFILNDLNRHEEEDRLCFSYTPLDRRFLHNTNLLAASLLAETAAPLGRDDFRQAAFQALQYSAAHQRTDGSWYYGESPRERFVDNFHTGFVLVSFLHILERLDLQGYQEALSRGYAYWKETFIPESGRVRYYAGKRDPVDSHAAAQSILTLLAFRQHDPSSLESAVRVARWTVEHMQSGQGYFYYQLNRFYTNKIPYMRWSQAWMHFALSALSAALGEG